MELGIGNWERDPVKGGRTGLANAGYSLRRWPDFQSVKSQIFNPFSLRVKGERRVDKSGTIRFSSVPPQAERIERTVAPLPRYAPAHGGTTRQPDGSNGGKSKTG